MTPNHLLTFLRTMPDDAPLVFETILGPIGNGYHVTELKRARISSVDCGGRSSEWTESILQLLDGEGGRPMSAGKFTNIVTQSIAMLTDLGDAPLRVEFAHSNAGLQLYELKEIALEGGSVTVKLGTQNAQCKPAAERSLNSLVPSKSDAKCCGSNNPKQTCCT